MALSDGFKFDGEAPARVKKADRAAVPEGGPVRVSDLGLADKLYAHIKNQRKAWTPRNVYASGIKNDRRQQVLALLGVPPSDIIGEDHPEWAAVAELGTSIHSLVEVWMKSLGLALRSEFQVKYKYEGVVMVSGRADYEVEMGGALYILDIKTVGRKDFDEGAYGRKFDGYRAQLNVYGRALELEDGKHRDGIILLVCRDSGRLREYIIDLTAEEGDALLLRARAIMRCAAERRLPTGEQFGFAAMFNPYKTLCELQDKTGWVQQALNDGVAPEEITVARLERLYGGEK